jgi:Mor family transcriptional regulator
MEKLYQEIQDQINQLMSSKVAKYSDKELSYFESKIVFTSEMIDKLIIDYQSGISFSKLAKKYGTSDSQIHKYLKKRNIETRPNHNNNSSTLSKRQDVFNGMSVHEYCEKWNVQPPAYYRMKKRHKIS